MKAFRSKKAMAARLPAALIPALAIAACTVGPDYKKPQLTVPTEFRAQGEATQASSLADAPWWGVFNDPALQGLISQALANNQDIAVAAARIEQARALLGVSQSQSRPQLDYRLIGGHEKTFVPGETNKPETLEFSTFGALLDATWELDLWGRIRRSNEAARANLLAQEDVRRGVMLSLVSDVAASYFRLVELDRELAIAQDSARVYKQTLDLFTLRFEAGRDSRLPVERTQANYDAANGRIEDLNRAIAQQENALGVLLGGYPAGIPRGRALTEQTTPPQTPVGATTALMERRPDIMAAEQNMVRANAEIGVAVANFYPRVGLSALLGAETAELGHGWSGFSTWNIGLGVAGPIYNGGRLREIYNQRKAFWDETVAQYKKTVQVAFQETSDALVAQQTLAKRRVAQQSQVEALRRSAQLASDRYDAGRASYFEVLEAQQQLFPAEDALAQTQRDQLIAVVNLYKALGGGWNMAPGQWSQPAAAAPAASGGGYE